LLLLCLLVASPSFADEKGKAAEGEKTYRLLCASCHGESGKGDGPAAAALPAKPRSLVDTQYMKTLSDEHLFKAIKDGGAAVGKSPLMPPWSGQLSDAKIRDLVAYLRNISKTGK
jgi:cytochrome c oxidase cbb3-type subunit 3